MFVLLSGEISHQPAGVVSGHGAHQHRRPRLHLHTEAVMQHLNHHSVSTTQIRVLTSLSTMLARSSGCSMMAMKFSPMTLDTKMCDMASRRSGLNAWISSSWWTA